MDTPFIGMIALFGFNFAPRGWALCQGQLLSIAQNTALFSLLGTQYGGNGTTTFALPDLRGRVPIGQGQGPGLSPFTVGTAGGVETVQLNINQLPPHTHTILTKAHTETGNTADPTGAYLANTGSLDQEYYNETIGTGGSGSRTNMATQSTESIGGSQPHTNLQPYLTMNYCISLEGIYPARN